MAVLGARVDNSILEQHKVIFCVCEDFDNLKLQAKEAWRGSLHLHIDIYMCIEQIGGYEVVIQDECGFSVEVPDDDDDKELFFINLGGYKTGVLGEIHKQIFIVARNSAEAKELAKQDVFFEDKKLLQKEHCRPHVDDVIDINTIIEGRDYTIKLRKITDKSKIQDPEPIITGFLKV